MQSLFRNSRRKLSQGMVFWREVGAGTPVIFLHGAWYDSSQWVGVMESLGRSCHCFAPDLLGCGESDIPEIHYSINLEAEFLAEFLDALKLERVYLVGDSIGAWIAASYALKYPQQVAGLVLISPEGVEIDNFDRYCKKMQSLAKRPEWILELLKFLRPLTKMFGWDGKVEQDLQQQRLLLQNPTSTELLYLRQLPEIKAELLQNQLSLLTIPTLVIQAGKDSPESLSRSNLYASLIPQAQMKTIAHGGNNLPGNCANVVATDIKDLLFGG
ncbi:alpha/beta fold hydrolase [Calothrix sp. 336/3]|uniref:alpha/beta fold hydrolase n=1 Tax=Calothrix sp. 336/3 TaxID=1337936 RepID=UPI0004E375B2|nr:alpha/beta hydrolase [Calothrix sp. 336/3]AKG22531.1 alpha/beta hydrolase [Calothrix sp. 336/3]